MAYPVLDQRMSNYSTRSKSNRWTLVVFFYMLDTARVNSQSVHSLNAGIDPRKSNSFRFGWDLSMQLLRPHVQRRFITMPFLLKTTRSKMALILGPEFSEPGSNAQSLPISGSSTETSSVSVVAATFPSKRSCRKRCRTCEESVQHGSGFKKSRDNVAKVCTQCQSCCKPICSKHFVLLCSSCSSNPSR